jgi:5-methylcytosine-specific restriction enzyme B
MARLTDYDPWRILNKAEEWRDQCLIAGKSIFWLGRDIWSSSNLNRFKTCFIDRPDTSKIAYPVNADTH